MFKKLMDFSYKRSGLEALGFYLAYLLLGMILGIIFGIVYTAAIGSADGFHTGLKAGSVVAVIYCIALGFLVLRFRKLYTRFSAVLLYLLSILSSMMMGSLLGLIFISLMTTMKPPGEKSETPDLSEVKTK